MKQRQNTPLVLILALIVLAGTTFANDLIIHLTGSATFSTITKQYRCDASAAEMGLPAGSFSVEYINGGENGLVVVPVSGQSLVFANVIAASGARYTARQYTWWDAGGSATFYSDSPAGKMSSSCHPTGGR